MTFLKRTVEKVTPIGMYGNQPLILPNHSGTARHPETLRILDDRYIIIGEDISAPNIKATSILSGATLGTSSMVSGQVVYKKSDGTLGGDNKLFWDITGQNLGIGTAASPTAKIHVISKSTENGYLTMERASNDYQVYYTVKPTGLTSGTNVTWLWGMKASSNNFTIQYYNGVSVYAMEIDNTGKIGFGTITPEDNVHIYANSTQTTPHLYLEQDGSGDSAIEIGIVGDSYIMGIDNSDGDSFKISYSSTQGSAVLGTNDRLIIDSSGNINIKNNLDVDGTFNADGISTFGAPIRLKNYTVATLPVGVQGDMAYVTDTLMPGFHNTVVGGGAVVTPVFYDGTNWIVI